MQISKEKFAAAQERCRKNRCGAFPLTYKFKDYQLRDWEQRGGMATKNDVFNLAIGLGCQPQDLLVNPSEWKG